APIRSPGSIGYLFSSASAPAFYRGVSRAPVALGAPVVTHRAVGAGVCGGGPAVRRVPRPPMRRTTLGSPRPRLRILTTTRGGRPRGPPLRHPRDRAPPSEVRDYRPTARGMRRAGSVAGSATLFRCAPQESARIVPARPIASRRPPDQRTLYRSLDVLASTSVHATPSALSARAPCVPTAVKPDPFHVTP